MSRRVLMAWELGGNLGHIVPLIAAARVLRERGHQVVFALRDLTNADLLARNGFAFLPAPVLRRPAPAPTYSSYAEMLASRAFPSAKAAFTGALAWRSIFRAVRPDVLVADHAPIALLAARGTGLRTVLCGVPFSIPPPGRPLPRFDRQVSDAAEREAKLLLRLNSVLAVLRGPALGAVSELYRADATAIKWLPELDFFGPRTREDYVGPLLTDAGDVEPEWPSGEGAKILLYLRPDSRLSRVFDAITGAEARAIAYVPNADPKLVAGARAAGIHLAEKPLKMSALLPQCDALVCHGGNLSAAAALAGKPVLLLPIYLEQQLTAMRAAQIGIAAVGSDKIDLGVLAPGGDLSRTAAKVAKRQPARMRSALEALVSRIEGRRETVSQ